MLLDLLGALDRRIVRTLCAPAGAAVVPGALRLGVDVVLLPDPGAFRRASGPLRAIAAAPLAARSAVALARPARRAEVVWTNDARSHVIGAIARRATKAKLVARVHDIIAAPAFGATARATLAAALMSADRVLPVSAAAALPLGRSASKVRVIHNGVPGGPLRPEERVAVRARLQVPTEARLVVSVGRLTPWKGHHLAIQAFRSAPAGAVLLVVGGAAPGDAAYERELRARAQATPGARMLGARDDAREIIAAADLLVHAATLPDPLPTVLLEAIAAGTFVIAADAGGVPEIVTSDAIGIRVPRGDARALGEALAAALARSDARDEQASAVARAHFSLDRYAAEVEEELITARAASSVG